MDNVKFKPCACKIHTKNIHIRHVRYMHACKQVLRPQVQVPKPQVRVQVQVLRPQVQVQVLQKCTRVQLKYKYKYRVHISGGKDLLKSLR